MGNLSDGWIAVLKQILDILEMGRKSFIATESISNPKYVILVVGVTWDFLMLTRKPRDSKEFLIMARSVAACFAELAMIKMSSM